MGAPLASETTRPSRHHFRFHAPHTHLSSVFGDDWFAVRAEGFARFFGTPTFLVAQTAIVGVWIALNVFFGIFGGTPGAAGEQVAWVAHIGGFVYGLVAIRLFMPRQT